MATGTWGPNDGPNIFRVNVKFRLGISQCQTGFYLRDIALQGWDAGDVADDVDPWVTTNFRTILSQHDIVTGVDVVNIKTAEGAAKSYANTNGTINNQVIEIPPAFLSVSIQMPGERRKRYGQGRMLWPVRFDSWVDTDTLNAAGRAAFQGALDALAAKYVNTGVGQELALCNVHEAKDAYTSPTTGVVRPAVPASYYDVTTLRINAQVSHLHSRKAGVGS